MFELALRRLLGVCLCLLVVPSLAAAQDARAILELVVNDVAAGEAPVVLRGSDVLIGVGVLTEAGLRAFDGEREQVGGEDLVSLASLAPAVSFRVDERDLRLHLTAHPELLGARVRDLYAGAPVGLVYKANTSGFLNYSISHATGGRVDLLAESAISIRGALVYNTVSATRQSTVRGVSSLTIDERAHMRRWTFGDNLGYGGPLGGDAWVGGITVSKEFAINPYYFRYPTLSLSAPILVPSVMEVQVNGQVVSREQVAPGRLEVRNLPLVVGRNDAQVIVRDAFGNERAVTSNYYMTTTALAKGVHEYQYTAGLERRGVGFRSWDYRSPVALARHRVGVSDVVTMGGRFEFRRSDVVSGGPTFNVRLPVGELELAGSASRREGHWGNASLLGFMYTRRPISAGGSAQLTSRWYSTLTPHRPGEEPARQLNGFASASLGGRVSLTLQHSLLRLHQGIERTRSGLLSTIRIARRVELSGSVSRTQDERGGGHEAYASLTVLFGDRGTASVGHVRDARGHRMTTDIQRSLPAGEGYGYQLHAESGDQSLATGVARYQSRFGRYELRQESIAGQTNTIVSAAGSLVVIGGGLHASRPVQDSFALVRVPGVKGVRAFASHQPVGATGSSGDLLIPDLQAYYGNILDVADADIPLNYSVADVAQTLALPYRGGAVALFPVQRIQRAVGTVTIGRGPESVIPAYGELVVTASGRAVISPVGANGAFYFEDVPQGAHPAVVRDREGRECAFTIVVPETDDEVVKLGTLRCEVRRP